MTSIIKVTAVAAAMVFGAGAASAASYVFDTDGPDVHSLTMGDLTVTASAKGILNFCGAKVAQTTSGLGVNGCPDLQPNDLDGFPVGSSEKLTFSFAHTVLLEGVKFSGLGSKDDYNLYIDGHLVGEFDKNDGNPLLVGKKLDSFSIEAVGEFKPGGGLLSCFNSHSDKCGNDKFRVYALKATPMPSEVPLPAAGWMLLAGVGGLFAAKRRK